MKSSVEQRCEQIGTEMSSVVDSPRSFVVSMYVRMYWLLSLFEVAMAYFLFPQDSFGIVFTPCVGDG